MPTTEQEWKVDEVMPILRKVSLFQGLPEEEIRKVARIVRGVTIPKGEILFEEGEPGEAFFIVYRGAIEIVKDRPGGDEEKLAVRRAGEGFGEMALLNDAPRSATARAQQDSRLILVPRDEFQRLLDTDSLPVRLMEYLARALRSLNVRFAAQQREAAGGPDPSAVSRLIQQGLVPRNAPHVAGYDIAAGTTMEEGGSGDTVWDAFPLQDGGTGLVTLSVKGEGLPPGHQLGLARAMLRDAGRRVEALEDLLPAANEGLVGAAVPGVDQFVECGLTVLREDGLQWASAGRTPGGVIRRNGTFEEFTAHGPPLGMLEGFRYGVRETPMGPGDILVVLSRASAGLFRGAADLVASLHGKPAGEVVSTVHRAIRKAQDGEPRETTVLFARKH